MGKSLSFSNNDPVPRHWLLLPLAPPFGLLLYILVVNVTSVVKLEGAEMGKILV